jgi:hypothetical protein
VPAAVAASTPASPQPAVAAKPSAVEPLDADSVRLHLTISRDALAKLEAARDALSHSRPGASMGEIVEAALDHVQAWALGGPTTVEGIRLACRAHNQLAARRVFGDAWMDRFARKKESRPPAAPP